MSTELKQKVFKSSLWSFLGSSSRQMSGLMVFIVLSRLLTPADFGTIAMAAAFVEVLNMMVKLGLTTELVRRESVTDLDRTTAFWLSVTIGFIATTSLFLFSTQIASLLKVPDIALVLQYLCIMPLLTSLSTVHEAILQREFEYKTLALRTLFSNLGAGVLAIVLAYYGWGFYSLVFQSITSLLITLIMYWSHVKWRPTFAFSMPSARWQLAMGRPQMGYTMLNVFSTRSVDIIVGMFLGTSAVGYLRIAAKLQDFLVQFTIEPVVSVALPTFSKLQNDIPALNRAYRSLTQLCGLVTFPAFLGLGAIAPLAIALIFGPQWQPSAVLMQILCIASVAATINYFFKPAMLAIGKPHVIFYVNVCQAVLQLTLVLIGAQFNVYMVMLGMAIASLVFMVVTQQVLKKYIGLTSSHVVIVFYPPLISAAVMAAVILAVRYLVPLPANTIVQLAIFGSLGAVLYAGMLFFVFRPYLRNLQDKVLPTILSSGGGKLKFLKRFKRSQTTG